MKKDTTSIPDRLRQLGYSSYREYLSSPHWQSVKARFWKSKLVRRNEDGKIVCSACGKLGILHLHHKSYKSLGKENLNHLVLLCEEHHFIVHQHLNKDESSRRSLWRSTNRVIRRMKKGKKPVPMVYPTPPSKK